MYSLMILIISVLCIEVSVADNLYEKAFEKTNGVYFASKEAVNWTDAITRCKNIDLELASVISEEEEIDLHNFIVGNKLIPKDKWSGYWLSGMRHDDGYYYWNTTGTQVGSSFRGWVWGEPSHAYEKENCVELKWDEITLGWNDYFCDEARRYICQIPRKFKPNIIKKKIEKLPLPLPPKEWGHRELIGRYEFEPIILKEYNKGDGTTEISQLVEDDDTTYIAFR